MKAKCFNIEVDATLTLSKRELQLLNHIFSYDHSKIVEGVVSTCYAGGGVNKDELLAFAQTIRSETQKLMDSIEKSSETLFKNQ